MHLSSHAVAPVKPTMPPEKEAVAERQARWPALDGLRGVAVLMVMTFHGHVYLCRGGFHGVDLFFVLSGFLITALLIQERRHGAIHLGRFYLRRALRLLPAVAALLLVCWFLTMTLSLGPERAALERDLTGVLLYFYNWCEIFWPPRSLLVCLVWSLSLEEQFYLLWPVLLAWLLARKAGKHWALAVAVLGFFAPPVLRWTSWGQSHSYYGTDSRLDALAAGCIVGLLVGWGWAPRTPWARGILRGTAWAAAAVMIGHFALSYVGRYPIYGGFTLFAASAAVLIAALVWSPPPALAGLLSWQPLGWVGRVSYGTYLWHLPIDYAVYRYGGEAAVRAHPILLIVAALAAGAVSHYALERPFLRLKDRLHLDRVLSRAAPPAESVFQNKAA